MKANKLIARRYAKGLVLAFEQDEFDFLQEELFGFVELAFFKSKELTRVIEDPAFAQENKKKIITKIASKLNLNHKIINFLMLLIDKGRLMLLPAIHKEIIKIVDQVKNRVRVSVKSISPLLDNEILSIKQALSKNNEIIIEEFIDKDLLGGIRLEYSGKVFDASIQAKLQTMEKQLLNKIGFTI